MIYSKIILTLVFSAIGLKYSLKMLTICNGSITVAPLFVGICIFDVDEFLIAIKFLMPLLNGQLLQMDARDIAKIYNKKVSQ